TTESEYVKARLHRYQSEQPCETCHGARLKPEVLAVRLHTQDDVRPGGTGFQPVQHGLKTRATKKKRKPQDANEIVPLTGYSIADVSVMTVASAKTFFDRLKLS